MAPSPWNASLLARWPGVTVPIDDQGGAYVFDEAAADRAAQFFPTFLTHHQGEAFAGRPFALLDWQRDLIVRPLFGWKRRRDGLRRFRKLLLFIPKKQGKTQLVAGLSNLLLFCESDPGAQIMVAAADRDQARLLFNEARAMVEDCPDLSRRADVLRNEIVYRDLRATMKVISAEARTKHGPNLYAVIIDELHAQPDRYLVETLEKGIAARLQPLIIYLSTAGDDLETIAYEEYDYAKRLIAGTITDDRCLPVVFEAPAAADWQDPETWRQANPSLGVTVLEDYFVDEVVKARNEPRKLNAFKRLHLNIWTQQHTAWLSVDQWDRCRQPAAATLTGNPGKVPCFAGLDLSSKIDLTALVLALRIDDEADQAPLVVTVGPPAPGEFSFSEPEKDQPAPAPKRLALTYRVALVPFFWMPEETLDRRVKDDGIPYDVWRDQGWLRVTPGDVVDYDVILQQITDEIAPAFRILEFGYDPWNATQFALQLSTKGFTVTEVPQTFRHLSEPSKVLEALVVSGRVQHDGNAVMRRCVENVATVEDRAENIRPVKPSKKKRIDGVVASVLALSRLIVAKPPKRSRYASGPVAPIFAR